MITASAANVLLYSAVVLGFSLLTLIASLRWRCLRGAAVRLMVVFSVAAAAAGYVWLDLGPAADARLRAAFDPPLPALTPRPYIDVTFVDV